MADFARRRQVARNTLSVLASGVVAAYALPVTAQGADDYSTNDYGGIGLLQTRTARFAPDGEFEVGAAFVNPYRRYYMTWQILPWLETTFRYTDTTNLPIGSGPVAQSQGRFFKDILNLRGGGGTYLDRGADVKIRLSHEGEIMPQFALGLQDAVGTGLFSGEYLVASKRYYDFDFTLGVGWGYLGSRGSLPNPYRILGHRFSNRDANVGEGGKPLFGNYFAGRHVGLFGGVEYHTPVDGLTLKLEYNGASPKRSEPNGNVLSESIPFNAGIDYRPASWIDLGLAFERGNSVMLRTGFRFNLHSRGLPKFDPPPEPVIPRGQQPTAPDRPPAPGEVPSAPPPGENSSTIEEPRSKLDMAAQDFARREFRRLPMDRRLASVLTEEGFAVAFVRVDGANATAEVNAPYWMTSEDYRTAGMSVLDASDGAVTRVMLSALLNGIPVSTLTAIAADTAAGGTESSGASDEGTDEYAARIFKGLKAQGYQAYAVYISELSATVYISQTAFRQPARNVGRVARVMANNLPPNVEAITVVGMTDGVPTSRVTVIRNDLERAAEQQGSPEEIWADARIQAPDPGLGLPDGAVKNDRAYPHFSWSVAPGLRQHVGDVDQGIYLADVSAVLSAKVEVLPGLSLRASANKFLFGNLGHIDRQSDSVLPHVRSDIVEYLQHGRSGLTRLQADYLFSPAKDVYARVSAGLFEWMYGGVGAEVLYRPFGGRFGIGADINWVKQRDFNVMFDFRNYDVVTGHVSFYYDLPVYGLESAVHVGRYLAGDRGVTIDLSRRFENGIRVGAFATFTNVSSRDFGEGSFDKGFYMIIPLDLFLLRSSKSNAGFVFRPLTRDGGQMLDIAPRLNELVNQDRKAGLERDWTHILD
jgi:Exopolysaccharide biosynthesis protein YbjH